MQPPADAWRLVRSGGPIDAMQFLRSLRDLAGRSIDDTRDQLLLRDGLQALEQHWGPAVLQRRLRTLDFPKTKSLPADAGFHMLGERMVDATDPNALLQMLRELGVRVRQPTTLIVGGSLSLMLDALIVRVTDDVDLVDELPATLRAEPVLLDELSHRYGLKITHFQSHYLPNGWASRVQSIGQFDRLQALRVDPIDVLVGKLFSRRTKDLDDVRHAWPLIDQKQFRHRVSRDTAALAAEPGISEAATRNWYIVTGETALPATT